MNQQSSLVGATAADPVLIAGAGPSGMRVAQELARAGREVVLLNAERWRPYNRVQLTPVLSGEAQVGQIFVPDPSTSSGKIARFDGVALIDVDMERHLALTSSGRAFRYSDLVLALGSRAFVPNIPGTELEGVFVFRNFDDAQALVARTIAARKVAVIGGGLLGLEAARGMVAHGAQVTIVEHEDRLMPRQLDRDGALVLMSRIEALGIEVRTGMAVRSISGTQGRVAALHFADDSVLQCDTVLVCTGVRANTQLAAELGLDRNRGILVDDQMRSSHRHIYAVGECAEHGGQVYGLVGPCFEQANVVVASILGKPAHYKGSSNTTKLKVMGADVFSAGDVESLPQIPGMRSYVYSVPAKGLYRRIFVRRGRIHGALGVGPWPDVTRLQQAVAKSQAIRPWHLLRFRLRGLLWPEDTSGVEAWAPSTIVCNCTGVTKGALVEAVSNGADTIADLRLATGANTVCGTCAPQLQTLLGTDAAPLKARFWKWILAISGIAVLAALASLMLPRIPLRDNFQAGDLFTTLWFDSQAKQVSGYTLLGLSAAAALISLRKRIPWLRALGSYDFWRIAHLALGLLAALGLVWHTGLRLGSNLNFLLMISFLLTLITGAVAGLITGGEHELRAQRFVTVQKPRAVPLWLHIIGVWPLPVLLLFHVLSVYLY